MPSLKKEYILKSQYFSLLFLFLHCLVSWVEWRYSKENAYRPSAQKPKKWPHTFALVHDIHSAMEDKTNWDNLKNVFIFQLFGLKSKMLLYECWLTYVSLCCVVLDDTRMVSVGLPTKTLLIRARRRVNSDVVWSHHSVVHSGPYSHSGYSTETILQLKLINGVFSDTNNAIQFLLMISPCTCLHCKLLHSNMVY